MLKPYFEISKHMELVEQTVLVLKNDGKGDVCRLLSGSEEFAGKTGLQLLAEGTKNADFPFARGYIFHTMHFHHPWHHRGYLGSRSSAAETAKIFALAGNNWQNGSKADAVYHLGRALHLIQDINIPHHAAVTAGKGHGSFEKWLTQNGRQYIVESGGFYSWQETFRGEDGGVHCVNADNVIDWIDYGSHLSYPLFARFFAGGNLTEETYQQAAALIMPNVLRLSAGFIHRFFSETGL